MTQYLELRSTQRLEPTNTEIATEKCVFVLGRFLPDGLKKIPA